MALSIPLPGVLAENVSIRSALGYPTGLISPQVTALRDNAPLGPRASRVPEWTPPQPWEKTPKPTVLRRSNRELGQKLTVNESPTPTNRIEVGRSLWPVLESSSPINRHNRTQTSGDESRAR